MRAVKGRAIVASAVLVAVVVAAGCGGSSGGSSGGSGGAAAGAPVNSSTCGAVQGKGQFTITSDFPLQGSSSLQTKQMNQAIAMVLEQNNWKAGKYTVQFQPCDDSTAQLGSWDSATCSANANAYVQTSSVIGNIGTYNSGCAEIEVPVLNQAPGGAIAMVSPANTWPGLTQKTKVPGEPDKYYPTGTRNYARVVAADNFQGPALAQLAKDEGVKSVYILNDKQAYGAGVAYYFQEAAKALGITVLGNEAYNTKTGTNYQSQFQQIKSKNPDAIMIGGLICENGGQVIKDKVAVLGDNSKVKLLLPDGFTTDQTITDAGGAATGAFMSVAGVPPDQLTGAGATFVKDFEQKYSTDHLEPYTPYAAAAAAVMLNAIAQSDGTRASVTEHLLNQTIGNSVLGGFQINSSGDTNQGSMTIYTAKPNDKHISTYKVITPDPSLVITL
jgi:branched-chain amino acid transport system substrate-binding protein